MRFPKLSSEVDFQASLAFDCYWAQKSVRESKRGNLSYHLAHKKVTEPPFTRRPQTKRRIQAQHFFCDLIILGGTLRDEVSESEFAGHIQSSPLVG